MPNHKLSYHRLMKWTALFISLVFVVLSPWLTKVAKVDTAGVAVPDKREQGTVVYVTDGDTFKVMLDGVRNTVRLIGIDTPETKDPRKPVQCFGKEASLKAKNILLGKKVFLEADPVAGNKDIYGRLLRYAFLEDGTNVNQMMISEGFAFEYDYDNQLYKYRSDFKLAEKDAKQAGKGLWADSACAGIASPI
jgi:micrococcal nuclease